MLQGKAIVIALVAVAIGFAGGFVLRPIIAPAPQTVAATNLAPVAPTLAEARGAQYFVAHIEEARQVVAGCRDGAVRGGECATAEEAIIKVEAQGRRKRFLGN